MAWEQDDTAKQQLPFTFASKNDFQLALFPELMHHHHQHLYPMTTSFDNKSYQLLTDSHVVPDEDDHHPCDYYHSQVAPATRLDPSDYDIHKTASEFDQRTYLFDLEKPPDDAAAVTIINSKTSASISSTNHEAADYKDLVVPHHHDYDCELSLASKHPNSDLNSKLPASNPNEAEIALVPSLSVCSNDLPHPRDHQDQDAQSLKEQSQQSLTNKSGASRKRKYNRATTMEVRSVLKRKQRVKINRKMRALQGLIPNCEDKVDKAAILDDAIVYLKTLQLQLQMMSMPPPPMHLTPFPMIGFSPFVPLPPTLILPHPSITLPASINSHHLLKHDYNQSSLLP